MSQAEVVDYVGRIRGIGDIFKGALAAHRTLDGFKALQPFGLREVRAVVGTGIPTISQVRFNHRAGKAILDFQSGDVTVPARSGSQGASTAARGKPMGADIPISYVCNIEHVPLAGNAKDLRGLR